MNARERELLRKQLVALRAMSEAALALLEEPAPPAPAEPEPDEGCPHCGNAAEDLIQNTSATDAPGRQTCLSCGKSWRPGEEIHG